MQILVPKNTIGEPCCPGNPMSRNQFEAILYSSRYTNNHFPNFRVPFHGVHQMVMVMAWNSNMLKGFALSCISCLNKQVHVALDKCLLEENSSQLSILYEVHLVATFPLRRLPRIAVLLEKDWSQPDVTTLVLEVERQLNLLYLTSNTLQRNVLCLKESAGITVLIPLEHDCAIAFFQTISLG